MHTDEMVPAVAKQLLDGLLALKKGDFSVRMPSHLIGIDGKIADCFNEVSELNQRMADELKRIRSVVGKEASSRSERTSATCAGPGTRRSTASTT
jgi:hypothetical protein